RFGREPATEAHRQRRFRREGGPHDALVLPEPLDRWRPAGATGNPDRECAVSDPVDGGTIDAQQPDGRPEFVGLADTVGVEHVILPPAKATLRATSGNSPSPVPRSARRGPVQRRPPRSSPLRRSPPPYRGV